MYLCECTFCITVVCRPYCLCGKHVHTKRNMHIDVSAGLTRTFSCHAVPEALRLAGCLPRRLLSRVSQWLTVHIHCGDCAAQQRGVLRHLRRKMQWPTNVLYYTPNMLGKTYSQTRCWTVVNCVRRPDTGRAPESVSDCPDAKNAGEQLVTSVGLLVE